MYFGSYISTNERFEYWQHMQIHFMKNASWCSPSRRDDDCTESNASSVTRAHCQSADDIDQCNTSPPPPPSHPSQCCICKCTNANATTPKTHTEHRIKCVLRASAHKWHNTHTHITFTHRNASSIHTERARRPRMPQYDVISVRTETNSADRAIALLRLRATGGLADRVILVLCCYHLLLNIVWIVQQLTLLLAEESPSKRHFENGWSNRLKEKKNHSNTDLYCYNQFTRIFCAHQFSE